MQRNKPGLADLGRLRRQAEAPEPAAAPSKVARVARKRSPFLPPSGAPSAQQAGRGETRGPLAAAPRKPAAGEQHRAASTASPEPDARLPDDDRKLFRNAVRHVEKMKDPGRVLLAPVAPAPPAILKERRRRAAGLEDARDTRKATPADAAPAPAASRQRALSDTYAPAGSDTDDSRYLKPGHGTDVLRDLKRGRWPIGATLDLHGSTLEDARERFDRYIDSCLAHDVKCVRIIHGKGHGSPDGDAVLRTTVRRWLTQIAEVIAYTECSEADGGSGAVQVLLK